MKRVSFLLRGILYTVLANVWLILIVCLFMMGMFVTKSIIPILNKTPIQVPMMRDHGMGPN